MNVICVFSTNVLGINHNRLLILNTYAFQEKIKQVTLDKHVHNLIYKEILPDGSSPALEKLLQQYSGNFLAEEFQCIFRNYSGTYVYIYAHHFKALNYLYNIVFLFVCLHVCVCVCNGQYHWCSQWRNWQSQEKDWRSQSTPNEVLPNEVLPNEVRQMKFCQMKLAK